MLSGRQTLSGHQCFKHPGHRLDKKLVWLRRLFIAGSVLGILLVGTGPLNAQVGKETKLWQWTKRANHHDAIVQVNVEQGMGTGVIFRVDRSRKVADGYLGYCLTANHVVAEEQGKHSIQITYRNGRGAKKCQVVKQDEENDIAIIWVWVPQDIQPATISSRPAVPGDTLEFTGLGGGSELKCCLRHFRARTSQPSNHSQIFADVALLPGDSGGPVFNSKREVVGVISGGWFWWDGQVRNKTGRKIKATWPARACNASAINDLIRSLNKNSSN